MSNKANKQRLINVLCDRLQQEGCEVLLAKADADVLLINSALKYANEQDIVLVGDDTDLRVLLCSFSSDIQFKIYFRPEPKASSRTLLGYT